MTSKSISVKKYDSGNLAAEVISSKSLANLRSVSTKRASYLTDKLDRQRRIATAAYYRAEKRGFIGGNELQDWLNAEAEIENYPW